MFTIQSYGVHVGADSSTATPSTEIDPATVTAVTVIGIGLILVFVALPIGVMYYLYKKVEANEI